MAGCLLLFHHTDGQRPMKITRKFTTAGSDPFASTKWVTRSSKISNPDGSVVFEMKDVDTHRLADDNVFSADEPTLFTQGAGAAE